MTHEFDITEKIQDFAFYNEWAQSIMDKIEARKFNRSMLTRGQRHMLLRLHASSGKYLYRQQYRVKSTLEKHGFIRFSMESTNLYEVTVLGREYIRRFCF